MSEEVNMRDAEVDNLVTGQADDDSAWESPITVRRPQHSPISIPSALAARAAFFARLHHAANLEDYVARIVKERIEMEEAAFTEVKRELAAK